MWRLLEFESLCSRVEVGFVTHKVLYPISTGFLKLGAENVMHSAIAPLACDLSHLITKVSSFAQQN